MKKLWRIAVQEYRQNVLKKSFIVVFLSVPGMIILGIGIGLLMESLENNPLPVGVVDQAGIMDKTLYTQEMRSSWTTDRGELLEFIDFSSESEARSALELNQIQVYYLLPADYLTTRRIEQVSISKPGENAWEQFFDLLQINSLIDQPPKIANLLTGGTAVTVRSLDGNREASNDGPTFSLLMPLFITMAFLFMLMMSSGYMLGAVTEEKENRTMEVLVTSISPLQLMGGKILGIVGISLTLLISWAIVIVVGIFIASRAGITWFGDLNMDWGIVFSSVAIAIPAYVMAVALMTAIGAMVTSTQEGQSVSTIFFILHFIPFYISVLFLNDPHSPLAVILSVLPFTALMTVGMRNLFTVVPVWQVVVSVVIQTLCAVSAIWLASRAFRLGMLRFGKRLHWRSLLGFSQRRAGRGT